MSELFSKTQISRLRAEFDKIATIDPCSPHYDNLIAALDAMDAPQLRQVHEANIRFLSALARNRLPPQRVPFCP